MAGSRSLAEQSPMFRVRSAVSQWRELLSLARELRGLDSVGARRLLEERGLIGPADGPASPRVRILYRMMRLLGLDPERVRQGDAELLRSLEHTCEGCDNRDRCENDHENGSARSTYQSYCPNAAKLDSLRFERANAPAS